MKHTIAVVLTIACVAWLSRPATADALADKAAAVLEKHCAGCHGGPSVNANANQGGFDYVRDPARMAEAELLVRFYADQSELYQRLRDDEMPPENVPNRPTADEIEIVRAWIAAGAPARVSRGGRSAQRTFITTSAIERAIARDLRSQSGHKHVRYVSLAHLHNAGVSEQELNLARKAMIKLFNSLTWSREIIQPRAIDDAKTIFRLNLRKLGWSREQWERLATRDPYATARTTREAASIRTATRTIVPLVRADWLVHAASQPPLYHELLQIPRNAHEFERHFKINTHENQRRHQVIRAGFNGSGVSRHNRIIERHALPVGGYYWQSFDFQTSTGPRNIFDFPTEFRHDGGEIIASLPNGFQVYMLVDRRGRRIDKAPVDIVTDPSRGDGTVTNGISCMGCHSRGIIDKGDEIRQHVLKNQRAFDRRSPAITRDALALYRTQAALDAAYSHDRRKFERALARAGVTAKVEPINATSQLFEAELTVTRAAAELGLTAAQFTRRLGERTDLRRKLGSLLVAGGTVKRDVFVAAFPEAARGLGLGAAISSLATGERLALVCDTGVSRACFQAGQAFYRGVGVRADHRRASHLFYAACDRGNATGCRALGHLYYRGHGVARNRSSALAYYQRACQLGSGGACSNAAFLYLHGRGTARDPIQAAGYHARACNLNRAGSCFVLATMFYEGRLIAKNRARAATLFEQACARDNARACGKLGHQYRWGKGVTIDWVRSYQFFKRGCDLGDRQSCADILDVAALLGVQ